MRFLSSPGSCYFEVMPGTLRKKNCMAVSLSGCQAGSVSSSTGTSTMFWCVLDSSLYWWFRLWRLRRFLVGCARFVCRGWEGSLLSFFSLNEDFETSSPLKWFYIGCFFSMSCTGVVFHSSRYDSQIHVLDFVQPALVGLGSRSPCSGCILHGWSYCCCVDFGQNR